MLDPARHTAPLTTAEIAVYDAIVGLLGVNAVPHGRAVFLFGSIAQALVGHAVGEHQIPAPDALADYLTLFAKGMGVDTVMVDHATPPTDAPKVH